LNNGYTLSGKITDLSNDQKRSKKPMIIDLSGRDDEKGMVSLNGIFDYTIHHDETINLLLDNFPVHKLNFSRFKLLPEELKRGQASLTSNINLQDEMFFANVGFNLTDIEFELGSIPDLPDKIRSLTYDLVDSIDEIDMHSEISQKTDHFRLNIDTNLDELIADHLKQTISNEVTAAREELKSRVENELVKFRSEIEDLINSKLNEIQSEFQLNDILISDQLSIIEEQKAGLNSKLDTEKEKLKQQANDELMEKADELLDKLKF
jgi:uncharacterized protein (TIGR03545 family)